MPTDEPRRTTGASGGQDQDRDWDRAEPDGEGPFTYSGRHAAPRRTLLRRLHMPVGKAVALAAMPSAMLLGTGITSPLAKADQQPENPYRGDSCVEMLDSPEDDQQETGGQRLQQTLRQTQRQEAAGQRGDATERDEPTARATGEEPEDTSDSGGEASSTGAGTSETAGTGEGSGTGETTESGAGTTDGLEDAAGTGTGTETGDTGETTEDTGSSGEGLLGGVGHGLEDLGDGLGHLLTTTGGGGDESSAESTEEPADPGQASEADGTGEAGSTGESGQPDQPSPTPTPTPESNPGPSADEASPEPEPEPSPEASHDSGATPESSAEPSPSAEQPPAQEEGAQPFPCPEEKLVPGVDEDTAFTVPNDSWFLQASSLTLYGLDYHGVVNVTTANGSTKQVLKFTAEKVDIGDLHQIVDAPGGVRQHMATEPGSTSTFRNGTVTMYTERLSGNLFGLIPITFDPEHQPPLDLPIANFTDVFVIQAGQFGGELSLRGMNSYFTHDGPTPTD